MALVMYDAIDVSQFAGLTMDAAAGYVDGAWPTFRILGRHVPPGTKLVSISVFGNPADCIDVEPGDATNNQGAAWARGRIDGGHWKPIVYTSASNVAAMTNALHAAGVRRDQVRLWSAHYTTRHICSPSVCGFPQADGTQWTDQAHGRNLDQSELENSFFEQAPKPPPPPPDLSLNPGDDPMICAFVNPFNGNTETFEVNPRGDLFLRSRNATNGGWTSARKLGEGFAGSASFAARKDGIDVFVMLKAGGVIAYVFDPQNPGWRRQSLTFGVT
jgi:hypothetical protein